MVVAGRSWSGIRQKGVASLLGAPASVAGLFFTFVTASCLSWCLVIFSWWLLALRSRLVRGYSRTALLWVEAASVCAAVLSHFVLLYFAVYWQLPLPRLPSCPSVRRRRWGGRPGSPHPTGANSEHSGDESHVEAGSGDEEEVHLHNGSPRAAAFSAAVAVNSPGSLQQRSACRPLTSSAAEAKGGADGVSLLPGDVGGLGGAASRDALGGFRRPPGNLARYFPLIIGCIGTAISLVHIVIHIRILERHRQSMEIILGLIRVISDAVLLTFCEIFVALRLESIAAQSIRNSNSGARVSYVRVALKFCGAAFAIGAIYVLIRFFWLVVTVNTMEHLKSGVIGSVDFCAKENMRMDPVMAKSWVWPALMHRRSFNFWTGSEMCSHASGLPSISYLDAEDHVLLVSPHCADGARPRIYLHRPENSEFNGSPDVNLPETARGNLEYHRQLEALYGTDTLAAGRMVVVHRDAATSLILAVEVDPAVLKALPRPSRTAQETAARRLWPNEGRDALIVPLGLSAAYTVLCEALGHEEYHLFPLDDAMLDAYSAGVNGVRAAQCVPEAERTGRTNPPAPPPQGEGPAGNVFIMLLDAVSRQEMQRSLPKLSRALADFAASKSTGHLAVEAGGAMTLGTNTAANLVPFFAGITANAIEHPGEVMFTDVSFMNRSVFVRAKEKYGDSISTALTSAFCHDLFEYLMGYTVPSSGAGGRVMGIDRYMYQPFCHLDYSGVHSNFKGPYSIVRRCMAGKAVWDHMANYTEATLEKQLEDVRRASNASTRTPARAGNCRATMPDGEYGKNFFHVMYMTEGHEGTHGVIPLVDDTLTRFFLNLRYKLKFFENPLNTFILLADHGNHMGHYFEYTNAGRFERGTPPTVLLIHPEVLDRVDMNKGRQRNTSVHNLFERTKRVSTPLDVYLTLADILNVEGDVYDKYKAAGVVHPASLFDVRDAASSMPARNCSQFSADTEHYACPLDFCRPG